MCLCMFHRVCDKHGAILAILLLLLYYLDNEIHKFKVRVKRSKTKLQPCILYIVQVSALSHN